MHERLFSAPTALTGPDLSAHAVAAGADRGRFEACLKSDEVAAKIEAHVRIGAALGVTGTPSFFIGRVGANGSVDVSKRIVGLVGVEVFKTALDDFLTPAQRLRQYWPWRS